MQYAFAAFARALNGVMGPPAGRIVRGESSESGKGRALRPTPPLRTRRASFPAPGSSLEKAPRSTRQRLQPLPSRYGFVLNGRRAPAGPSMMPKHTSSKVTAAVSPFRTFLVIQDQSEVSPLSGGAKLEPLSDPLQNGIRFLRPPLPPRPSVNPCRSPSTVPVGTVGLTTLRTRTSPEGRRPRLSAGSTTSARGELQAPRPDCLPFGSCLSASLACSLSRRLNGGSPELAIPLNPSSRPP